MAENIGQNREERIYIIRFKKETIYKALSDHVKTRIGSSAIHQTQGVLDKFIRILALKAKANLDIENQARNEAGLVPRKTLEYMDIEKAFEGLNLGS